MWVNQSYTRGNLYCALWIALFHKELAKLIKFKANSTKRYQHKCIALSLRCFSSWNITAKRSFRFQIHFKYLRLRVLKSKHQDTSNYTNLACVFVSLSVSLWTQVQFKNKQKKLFFLSVISSPCWLSVCSGYNVCLSPFFFRCCYKNVACLRKKIKK